MYACFITYEIFTDITEQFLKITGTELRTESSNFRYAATLIICPCMKPILFQLPVLAVCFSVDFFIPVGISSLQKLNNQTYPGML